MSIKYKRRRNLRKEYIAYYGEIPDNYEVHHKLPIRLGGTDSMENLIALSEEEHKEAHLKLYEEYGDYRDLGAYHLIGHNFTEAHRISSSNGGKLGGMKTYEEGLGIFAPDADNKTWKSIAGKAGGKKQKELGLGIHGLSKEENRINATKSGKMGIFTITNKLKHGLTEEEAKEEIRKEQSDRGKRGGVKNKGFIWINDGEKSFKYTKRQQEEKDIETFLKENIKYTRGRIL